MKPTLRCERRTFPEAALSAILKRVMLALAEHLLCGRRSPGCCLRGQGVLLVPPAGLPAVVS